VESTVCQNRLGAVFSGLGEVGSAHLARLGMEEADAHHRRGVAASVPSPIFPASRRTGKGPAAGRIGAGPLPGGQLPRRALSPARMAAAPRAWHTGRMTDKRPRRRAEADPQTAEGLARWEGEGGAPQASPRSDRGGAKALAAAERHVLERLGAAVVMEWNALPTAVRRAIFRHAWAAEASYDPVRLKARVARFLHDHKGDAEAP
jgi:hypothetical protein